MEEIVKDPPLPVEDVSENRLISAAETDQQQQQSASLTSSSHMGAAADENKPKTNVQLQHQSLKDRIMASIMNSPDEEEDGHGDRDICRVCRLSGEDTLYHPCLCTGSIKFVHQDCLLQWLKYSKKDVCELCNHKFSFRPLYRPDMPERLPLWDLLKGVFFIFTRFMRLTLTYTLVATCWLGLVPLMAARIHRLVFSGLLSSFFSSKVLQLFSTENVAVDIARGSLVVTLFLCTFISLVWLREQIMIGGPAQILHLPEEQPQNAVPETNGTDTDRPNVADEPTEPPNPSEQSTTMTEPTSSNSAGNIGSEALQQENPNEPTTSTAALADQQEDEEEVPTMAQQLPPAPCQPISMHSFQPVQHSLVADHPQQNGLQQQPVEGNDQQPNNQQQQPQAQAQAVQQQALVGADVEQQRFVDELTWQRLLGLDGSFAFIEHVFWTISLNVVFNIVFLYFPAQIGTSILAICGFEPGKIPYFEMPISIMAGLLVILLHGIVVHRIAKIFRLKSLYTTAGMICLMLKVFLLVVTELVFFPILCGWWLDICSLPLTGVTLDERVRNFRQYPSSSMFLHWLAGMVYVFYSASFILILRELLRPGVLWFIRNLHDPDFNPIQEMIEQPVTHHLRRLISSMTLFFSIIMLVVYVPLRLIKWLHPSTLPYVFTGSADTPLVEYSFELVLLQVIMPTLLEYSKAFSLLKRAVRLWCRVVGGWLQLDSYLLPAEKEKQDADQREQQRQRARDRLMRGDQEEQIGLLEALEAIEDDTTDGEEEEEGRGGAEETGSEEEGETNSQTDGSGHSGMELEVEVHGGNNNGIGQEGVVAERAVDEQAGQQRMDQEANGEMEAAAEAGEHPPNVDEEQQNEAIVEVAEGQQQQVQQRVQEQMEQRNLGAQHHALLRFRDASVTEDYIRPGLFPLRIALLLVCICLTAEALALLFFFVPVSIGRTLLSWLALTNQPIHDLYTVAAGLYTCWLCTRLAMLSREWAQKGASYVRKLFNSVVWLVVRVLAASVPLLVVIPFMLGFYFQMLVISPLRVAIFQSPLFFPWKEWAMGVVHFKIICASVLMGPDWWLKTAFEQIYADGIWNFRLRDLYLNLVLPIINALAFLIAFPYVLSKFLLVFIEATREEKVIVTRYSYPFLLGTICIVAFLTWQWQKLKMLANKIRNDKYLIGTQLVNFYRENTQAAQVVQPKTVETQTEQQAMSPQHVGGEHGLVGGGEEAMVRQAAEDVQE